MATSTERTVHDDGRDELMRRAASTETPIEYRVSWSDDPYAEAELHRRTERTRSMIERARRQLT